MGMHNQLKALVLAGDGLNCEIETKQALECSGFIAKIVNINDLLHFKSDPFFDCSLFVIPGGFSFGDELGSGKILSLKIKHGIGQYLNQYLDRGGAMLGICNGFQVMVQLGVFDKEFHSPVALAHNKQGHFINQWIGMKIIGDSIFTNDLLKNGKSHLELPIRHGEGRLVFLNQDGANRAFENRKCVLQYDYNVNGSWNNIAGIAAYEGRVMGLMPHPEAFWCNELHPSKNEIQKPLGIAMFESAFKALKGNHS